MQTVGNIVYGVSVLLSGESEKWGVAVFPVLFSRLFSIRFFSTDERINFVEQSRLFSSWRSIFFSS